MTDWIALIPARGGSKRIPRKNIRDFHGVPALARVVEMLLASGVISRVVVSTDDDEIARVAIAAGADVPFMRPADLADSYTGARPVIQHAIRELEMSAETVVGVFYATAVLTTKQDIELSAKSFAAGECDFVLSVAEYPAPVERALKVGSDEFVVPHDSRQIATRTQDLEPSYYDLGQFYWGTAGAWQADTPVVASRCRAYAVDSWRAVDIDTPRDWDRAERVYRMLYEQ
ncbi:pseudaminic acid cytidylyltransferase [Brevibacterium yomogidense]|uniref:pseudaminic acid cytidylyltransferase n=1 Tax=Brevibacterium yomogidense TaxID=946573 RepID=UPI000B359B83|nr:pseudaminic acid cytidylyltransferase [Brevibacterium yomogidense]